MQNFLLPLISGRQKQLSLSERTGIPFPTIKSWAERRSVPDIDRFIEVVKAAGADPAALVAQISGDGRPPAREPEREIVPGLQPDTVRISVLDVRAAAGIGRFNDRAQEVEVIDWPRPFLRRLGASPRMTDSLRSTGDSMAPTIEDGAFLLVDRSQNALPARRTGSRRVLPDVYVFVQGQDLRIKRVDRLERDMLALISDNFAAHPPEIVDAGAIRIIGKVVWWDNRL